MFILKKAVVNKYKSYATEQAVEFESNVTPLVGKNESGKTVLLEALAKLNYFTNDEDFKFDEVRDYPRSELKKFQRSGDDIEPIVCTFQLDQETIDEIDADLGKGVLNTNTFSVSSGYRTKRFWHYLNSDEKKYLENLQPSLGYSNKTKTKVLKLGTVKEIIEFGPGEDTELKPIITYIKNAIVSKGFEWEENLINAYIIKKYISPRLPYFLYFDEYYELPSRVSINAIRDDTTIGGLTRQQLETAKALFELAGIEIEKLEDSTNFESFIAELEATSNEITDTIFKYWSTNENLAIKFQIETITEPYNEPPEKILDIRVENKRHRITLPLSNRSRGFNWFFSFIVWFSKIQYEKDKNFILLLDEPGLNLHASAQGDLLRFIKDLSDNYQIIYTTHSPFMIESDELHRVRTVYDSEDGSIISDAVKEKDRDTLFPLQAALGYDIAQNLFVSKNNLLVEGPSDLNYLTFMSNLLEGEGRKGLRDDITIVPVGGLDRVASFISLLCGSKLMKNTCLLDSINNAKGKQRLDGLIKSKIIKSKHIRFFDEFIDNNYGKADIEDMFETLDYLKIFRKAFPEHEGIKESDLDDKKSTILRHLKAIRKGKDFSHYKPSEVLLGMGLGAKDFSEKTLDRFETMFKEINSLY